MIYRDTIRIIEPATDAYGSKSTGAIHNVKAIVEQAGGLRRGGYYDALASDARAYLDPNDSWLRSIGYKIEGMYATVTKYGAETKYRIVNKAVGERFATDSSISHIEIDLEESK